METKDWGEMERERVADFINHSLKKCDIVETEEEFLSKCYLNVKSKEFADWLTKNDFRMSRRKNIIGITKQIH